MIRTVFVFVSTCAFFATSALAFDVIPGRNRARLRDGHVQISIGAEADARAFFNALARGEERIMDSGVERVLNLRGPSDALKLRCVGAVKHLCQVYYANRERAYVPVPGSDHFEFRLSDEISATLFRKLDVAMRSAGHTALKVFLTRDEFFELGCAYQPFTQRPRCWLTLRPHRAGDAL